MIEQAKFTYSPLGKAFKNQIKAIEDEGEKQIKALEKHGKQLVKSNVLTEKEEQSIPLDKQKELSYELVAERTGEIRKLHSIVNFGNLVYHFKGLTKDIDFNNFFDTQTLFHDI